MSLVKKNPHCLVFAYTSDTNRPPRLFDSVSALQQWADTHKTAASKLVCFRLHCSLAVGQCWQKCGKPGVSVQAYGIHFIITAVTIGDLVDAYGNLFGSSSEIR